MDNESPGRARSLKIGPNCTTSALIDYVKDKGIKRLVNSRRDFKRSLYKYIPEEVHSKNSKKELRYGFPSIDSKPFLLSSKL